MFSTGKLDNFSSLSYNIILSYFTDIFPFTKPKQAKMAERTLVGRYHTGVLLPEVILIERIKDQSFRYIHNEKTLCILIHTYICVLKQIISPRCNCMDYQWNEKSQENRMMVTLQIWWKRGENVRILELLLGAKVSQCFKMNKRQKCWKRISRQEDIRKGNTAAECHADTLYLAANGFIEQGRVIVF